MKGQDAILRKTWAAVLAVFILAGSTGALMRFGFIYGFPGGLLFPNVRHAHSHLMYFGWVTPALMALMAHHVSRRTGRDFGRRTGAVIAATLLLGLAVYPPFLLYGYTSTQIGAAKLPVGVIVSSLNMLAWYVFAWMYFRARRGVSGDPVLRLWDGAVGFMLLASLGAWGRAALVGMQVSDAFLTTGMVHLFLDLFSNGWFVLAFLGLAYIGLERKGETRIRQAAPRYATPLLLAGLPLTFLLGVPVGMVPADLRALAGVGGALAAAGLGLHLWALRGLWRSPARLDRDRSTHWRTPYAMMALHAAMLLAVSFPGVALWGERLGLRVLYLHVLLLGGVSLGLFAAVRDAAGAQAVRGWQAMTAAVLLLLASLLPLSGLWPAGLRGVWALHFAAWSALGPVLAVLWTLWVMMRKEDGDRVEEENLRVASET